MKKAIYAFIYGFLLTSIILFGIKNYFNNFTIKKVKTPFTYKVIKVLNTKNHSDFSVVTYLVKINDHYYDMMVSTAYNNIIYKHDNDNCAYCNKNKISDYKEFCFSALDGLDSKELEKIN